MTSDILGTILLYAAVWVIYRIIIPMLGVPV